MEVGHVLFATKQPVLAWPAAAVRAVTALAATTAGAAVGGGSDNDSGCGGGSGSGSGDGDNGGSKSVNPTKWATATVLCSTAHQKQT